MNKPMTAQEMARKSVEVRGLNKMTPQERSEYMKRVRAGKSTSLNSASK